MFSVWQHRTLLPGDFIGEVILSLGDATQIGRLQTIDDTCGLMMALKRPEEPREGPFHVGLFSGNLTNQLKVHSSVT